MTNSLDESSVAYSRVINIYAIHDLAGGREKLRTRMRLAQNSKHNSYVRREFGNSAPIGKRIKCGHLARLRQLIQKQVNRLILPVTSSDTDLDRVHSMNAKM
jgi:hypothetical protein